MRQKTHAFKIRGCASTLKRKLCVLYGTDGSAAVLNAPCPGFGGEPHMQLHGITDDDGPTENR